MVAKPRYKYLYKGKLYSVTELSRLDECIYSFAYLNSVFCELRKKKVDITEDVITKVITGNYFKKYRRSPHEPIEYRGHFGTPREWELFCNFPKGLIASRLKKDWSAREMIEIPFGKHRDSFYQKRKIPTIEYNGKTLYSMQEVKWELGIDDAEWTYFLDLFEKNRNLDRCKAKCDKLKAKRLKAELNAPIEFTSYKPYSGDKAKAYEEYIKQERERVLTRSVKEQAEEFLFCKDNDKLIDIIRSWERFKNAKNG